MSDEIQKKPPALSLTESPRESAYELGLENEAGPAFPLWIVLAGWIWIVLGSVIMVVAGLCAELIVFLPGAANALGQQYGVRYTGNLWGLGFYSVFSALLVVGGVQCFRGKALDVKPMVIASIWMGLLFSVVAGFELADGQILQASVVRIAYLGSEGIAGLLFVAASVMAFFGRNQYKMWRMAQIERREREIDLRIDDMRVR